MLKAKDFWDYLCNTLEYRFFSGVPCVGFKCLYDKMDSKIMYYIPATKENVALGIISGAYFVGIKGGIFLDGKNFYDIFSWLIGFNVKYKIPILIFVYTEDYTNISKLLESNSIPYILLPSSLSDESFVYFINNMEEILMPGVVLVGKGELS